jgi:glycosyltransferase involved in cell wall biosynthesis
MKLLAVASTFPAGDTDPVPAFVKEQMIALKNARPGLHISVLAPHDSRSSTQGFKRWPAYDEYRFHYFWPFAAEKLAGRGIVPALKANPLNYLLIPFLFFGEFLAVLSLTKRLKPDVLYAHWFTPQGVVCSWVSRVTGTPFVFTTHASDVDVWRKIPLLGRSVVRSSARRAHAFTAVSRRSMQKLQRFFPAEQWLAMQSKGAIVPMGVAIPEVRMAQPLEQSDQTVILFLGRLAEKKGVQYLLPAYATARANLGNSLLIIAGDGPMRGHFEQQAAALGLGDRVRFAGFITGTQKASLLRRADLFVVPSILTASGDAEGLPVSLLEGLANGKICIATAESGADDILTHGRDGFLVPQKSVEALSAALIRAARLNRSVRDDMEAAARKTAQQFDWASIASRHYELLLKPFDGHQPR